ncbi:MAG: cytidine deaminase [Bacteroidetes bacterium]|nr:MAG: cytidine deaminase [Bacteroidota bacterium]
MTLTDEKKQDLIKNANEVRLRAYTPYSKYQVGAALLTTSGNIFTGVNVENAAYGVTMCAERSAVFSAVSAGERDFVAIAVATHNGGSPCGSCRQVLSEFGLDIDVLQVDDQGKLIQQNTIRELLPGAFQSKDLLK